MDFGKMVDFWVLCRKMHFVKISMGIDKIPVNYHIQ